MSARFSKLEAVDLAADEEDTEGEMESEECQVALVLPEGVREGNKRRRILRGGIRRVKRLGTWRWVLVAVVSLAIAVFIALMVARLSSDTPTSHEDNNNQLKGGAVATDSELCSEMSAQILRRGGSAVDAAITALLCLGAVHPESSGIGGGGFMVVYNSNGSTAAIDFREAAPAASSVDMFHSNISLSTNGGLAVAVPGELRGMELAHTHYGRLSWSELFNPVIELCRNGFDLTEHTAVSLKSNEQYVRQDEIMRELFLVNDRLKQEGDWIQRTRLAKTLQSIAKDGANAFYSGTIAESIVNKVGETGGILTRDDLAKYKAILKTPLSIEYNGYTLFAPPPPSGGVELLFPLNIISLYDSSSSSSSSSSEKLTYHRIVEAFKFMFALRSELGDTDCSDCDKDSIWSVVENMTSLSFAAEIKSKITDDVTHNVSYYQAHYATPPSDHGTTHVSVLSPDGMAVSVTSSINTYFGSKVVTDGGIFLNNEMDDFSSPNITNFYGLRPSESNFISPGKRPLSSTSPLIAIKPARDGGSRQFLIVGGSGGTRIPTATAQVVWRVLSQLEPIDKAIETRRLHHQLYPNEIFVEDLFPDDVIDYLRSKGHEINSNSSSYAVVQGVSVDEEGVVSAHSDSRKQGKSVIIVT